MATEKEVKLLDFWASPFSQRCKIVLAEKGVEYESKEDSLTEKSELLLKSNPIHKMVPVLLHGGKPICESLIIIEYIDEIWPGNASILPSDPYARAQARFWADYVNRKVSDHGMRILEIIRGEEEQQQAMKEFIEALKTLEVELGDNKYFGGETFGLVDIALVPFTSLFYCYEVYVGVNVERECPKIMEWAKRCKERESVAKTLQDPAKICEFAGIFLNLRAK